MQLQERALAIVSSQRTVARRGRPCHDARMLPAILEHLLSESRSIQHWLKLACEGMMRLVSDDELDAMSDCELQELHGGISSQLASPQQAIFFNGAIPSSCCRSRTSTHKLLRIEFCETDVRAWNWGGTARENSGSLTANFSAPQCLIRFAASATPKVPPQDVVNLSKCRI
eukprot:SAG11_NODE_647_length_7957_cov_2.900903_8_plen_171_part_00